MYNSKKICYTCLIGLSITVACVKLPNNFDPRAASNVYTGCRIKQIATVGDLPFNTFTQNIVYNANNDPISFFGANGPGHGGTGAPDYAFTYDSKHRLTEFVGLYSNGSYEALHRYKYEQNRIAVDTQFIFGVYGGPPPAGISYHHYSYDNFDRLIKDSLTFKGNATVSIEHFAYDAQGNLAGLVKGYDNKMNPRRTNRVWMFIDKNYSVNNPLMASAYNTSGLPLHFTGAYGVLLGRTYYPGSTDISYDCR